MKIEFQSVEAAIQEKKIILKFDVFPSVKYSDCFSNASISYITLLSDFVFPLGKKKKKRKNIASV